MKGNDSTYNPIFNYINDNEFKNIKFSNKKLAKYLSLNLPIILDFPSTGFYECIVSGLHTMCLCHSFFVTRDTAIYYFGNTIKKYLNISEALKHIDKFLNDKKDIYIKNIDMGNKKIIEILEELNN